MKVKIVIVHYGDNTRLLKCLESLGNITAYTDVIVSNNNAEPLKHSLGNRFAGLHSVDNGKNLGYAGGINAGLRYALDLNPKAILIITEDTTYEPDFLKEITAYAQKEDRDVVGPIVKDLEGDTWFQGGEIDKNRYTAGHTARRLDFIPGCCKLVKKEVFDKIGLLDEKYFIYYEDVDFDLRARRANFRIGIAENATVYHDTYHTAQAYKNMDYYLARNHLYFVWKLAPQKVKIREFIRLPKTIFEHIKRKQFDALSGIRDFFLMKMGKRA